MTREQVIELLKQYKLAEIIAAVQAAYKQGYDRGYTQGNLDAVDQDDIPF